MFLALSVGVGGCDKKKDGTKNGVTSSAVSIQTITQGSQVPPAERAPPECEAYLSLYVCKEKKLGRTGEDAAVMRANWRTLAKGSEDGVRIVGGVCTGLIEGETHLFEQTGCLGEGPKPSPSR